MKLDIQLGERTGRLETRNGRFELQWSDGAHVAGEASVAEVEPGIYSVLLEGRSFEAKIVPATPAHPEDRTWMVDIGGNRFAIEAFDPRSRRGRHASGPGEGRQTISAPMPGKIVRVLVTAAEPVEAGQRLLVVEAMKMQNEVKAPRAGVVAQVNVAEGATVAAGDVLVVIE
ncbi:MAG: biotin/lipoyl-containing protein [Bryobacteraceae bacterium]|nr:biotin/lipoyl-containing protein [Bryobacteraceae bacterium]